MTKNLRLKAILSAGLMIATVAPGQQSSGGASDLNNQLVWAAYRGETATVQSLLKRGANINALAGWQGLKETALHEAASEGRTDTVEFLLRKGAKLDITNWAGETAPMAAARSGKTEALGVLIGHLNTQTRNGLLRKSADEGWTPAVQLLLDRGADIEARGVSSESDASYTPLLLALYSGHLDTVKLLLSRHANVDARDSLGRTALMLTGSVDGVKLLLDSGADVHARNNYGCPVISTGSAIYYPDILQYLLSHGAESDLNGKCAVLGRVASQRCANGDAGCQQKLMGTVKLLLEHGAQVNLSSDSEPPLYSAASSGNIELVKLLLESGANANAQDEFGKTAIQAATENNHQDVAQLIMDYKNGTHMAEIESNARNLLSQQHASPNANASVREQFQQFVTQLQANPSDDALRTKIIQLVLTFDPKPAVPPESQVADGKAKTLFAHASSPEDMKAAAATFGQASLLAPWVSAYYFNQAAALDKAGDSDGVIRALNFYLLAAPNAADAEEVRGRIEGIKYAEEQNKKICADMAADVDTLYRSRNYKVDHTTVTLDNIDAQSDGYKWLSFKDVDNRPNDKYVDYWGWRIMCAPTDRCNQMNLSLHQTYSAMFSYGTNYTGLSVKLGDTWTPVNVTNDNKWSWFAPNNIMWFKPEYEDKWNACRAKR